jgi:hypothetical protein
MADAMQIDDQKQVLRQYYAGAQMDSPNGGFLMLLGIHPGDAGTAVGLLECSVSSLRYQLVIPKATRTERKKIKVALDAGDDPDCPRHGPGVRLVRAGKNLVCNSCGVAYARV